jgi:hypothetical protein
MAARWQDAGRIRAFLAGLRAQMAGRYGSEDAGDLVSEWVGFAEDYSNMRDPIPDIFAEIDRARSTGQRAAHRERSLTPNSVSQ